MSRFFLFVCFLWLMGCESTSVLPESESGTDAIVASVNADDGIALLQLQKVLRSDETWQEKEQIVWETLRTIPESRFHAHVAEWVLNEVLLQPDVAPHAQESIGHFTSVLLENDSRAVHTLLPAFAALEGYWSDARLRFAITRTLASFEARPVIAISRKDHEETARSFTERGFPTTADDLAHLRDAYQQKEQQVVQQLRNLRDRL